MKKIMLYYFLIFSFFPAGCVREKSGYLFEEMGTVKIDESKVVLTKFPNELKEITDSTIGVVNSGMYLSLYNTFTGRNTGNFSTESLSFDSIITETYRKKYATKREYIYDAKASAGMSGGNAQLLNFYYSEKTFYVYVNILAEVKYVNDPLEVQRFLNTASSKQMDTANVNIQIMAYLEFLFVLNDQLNIKKIIPLYERSRLKTDQYSPFFQKGFAINDSHMFVPIYNNEKGFADISAKMNFNNRLYCLSNYDLTNDSQVNYALPFETIDFSDYSIHNYFASSFKFHTTDAELLFSNGKEIVNVLSGEKIFSKNRLEKNEWISDFHRKKNTITLLTYKLQKKKQLSEAEKIYGANSLSDIQIKVYRDDQETIKKLPYSHTSFLVKADKVILIEKDKEHYYFKSIAYHEN